MYSTSGFRWKASCVLLNMYDHHLPKHTYTQAQARDRPFPSCGVPRLRHGSKSTHMHKPLFTVSLLPSCPLCKFQGWPVKAQSSIKTIMLPDFYDGKGSSADALRVERIHTLSPLSIFFIFPLPSSHSLRLSPLLCLCLLSASSRHIHIIWWEREGQRAWGGERGMQGCSFLFLSHCVWRSVPLLISTAGTRRFECWEFKQRLLGHWQLWCSSRVCMFWNVKRTLNYCFRLCLSSPKDWVHLKQKGGFTK